MSGKTSGLPPLLRKGKMVNHIETLTGMEINKIISEWISDNKSLKKASNELCNAHRIYNLSERRGIYRTFQRYVKNYCNDEQRAILSPIENGRKYSKLLSEFFGVPEDGVIDFIVDSKVQLMDVVRKIYGEERTEAGTKLYYFIYTRVRAKYGRSVVRSLCNNNAFRRVNHSVMQSSPMPAVELYSNVRPKDLY